MNATRTQSDSLTEITSRLQKSLQEYWGYDSFRPLQQESMLAALQGTDSLTVLPTGGGKSLCYQAPAVCSDGLAIVVSPLIALMKDQVDALTTCGIPAAFSNSSLSAEERQQVAERIRSKELKLLFLAPERLVQPRTIEFLRKVDVSFFAIDEAHCISNWGHDFRPHYRELATLRQAFPNVSIHAFTATATEQVRKDIVQQLQLNEPQIHVGNFDRPNLFYRVNRRDDIVSQMTDVIDRHPNESGIVYCISKAKVDETAATLRSLGHKALPYHAGMSPEQRKQHQDSFIDEEIHIIVATVAFGMGIDKSNVRYVIHAEMPRSIEAYQQESGRAGRDGLQAECCLFFSGRDTSTWEFLIDQSENEDNRSSLKAALKRMETFCYAGICRHQQLVQHFGQKLETDRCGACDVCLDEVDEISDSLVTAQKVISGVYRQEQRFGADYTALVLRGSRSKKVLANGHENLSTYGLLKDESNSVVRSWIDQLIAQEYLCRVGEHNVLRITEAGGKVLRGEETPKLTRPKQSTSQMKSDDWEGVDRGLFESLRQLRLQLANEKGVPPYVIFGDMTLRELAKYRPASLQTLSRIYGIGQQKLDQYGNVFLAAVLKYSQENDLATDTGKPKPAPSRAKGISASSGQYFELFDEGLSRDEVALQLDRTIGTVSTHLQKYIELKQIDNAENYLPSDLIRRIENAVDECGDERLKPIFEHLDGSVSYDDIRIVAATKRVRESD